MENLLATCGVAFLVVFMLLALLAALMVGITSLFPGVEAAPAPRKRPRASSPATSNSDPVVIAAVTAAVSTLIPGAHVVRMEEDR